VDLTGSRFAGEQLSRRFLKEQKLFPYEDQSGALLLAVAAPVDGETLQERDAYQRLFAAGHNRGQL
jgi:general secretion pathway protein E